MTTNLNTSTTSTSNPLAALPAAGRLVARVRQLSVLHPDVTTPDKYVRKLDDGRIVAVDIFAQALGDLGLPASALYPAPLLAVMFTAAGDPDAQAIAWLSAAQDRHDDGATWADTVAHADRAVTL